MPNNEEKKYTVDDILEEYDNAVNEKKGNDEVLPEEEFIAEADINDVNSVEEQDGIAEENSDEVTEEIFLEDVADEDEEIPEEILEIDTSESENADFILKKEENIEAMVEEAILGEASLWKDNIESEEMTEAEAAALVSEAQTETPDETEQPEDNSAADEAEKEETVEPAEENEKAEKPEEAAEEMPEDVNDKFLKRFLKGLFPWKGDSIGEIIRKIIFLAAVIVFVGAGVMLVSTLIQSEEAVEEKRENQSIITTTVATTVDSEGNVVTIAPTEEEIAEHNFNVAEHFKSINEDYVGYLEVDGCDIYEPIMQGDDNDYYLDHNYYGGTNKAGTVFLDYRCTCLLYTSPSPRD